MKARISVRALEDLDHIFVYITVRRGLEAADRFLDEAKQAMAFLTKNPEAGPNPRWATRHKELRFWVISKTKFLIYYFVDEQGVSIERVLDGRRDVKRIIEERLEEADSAEEPE